MFTTLIAFAALVPGMGSLSRIGYEILKTGISDTAEALKGKDIFYKCNQCQSILPSMPKDNTNCSCGNIGIDKDHNRLFVEEYSEFIILKRE